MCPTEVDCYRAPLSWIGESLAESQVSVFACGTLIDSTRNIDKGRVPLDRISGATSLVKPRPLDSRQGDLSRAFKGGPGGGIVDEKLLNWPSPGLPQFWEMDQFPYASDLQEHLGVTRLCDSSVRRALDISKWPGISHGPAPLDET